MIVILLLCFVGLVLPPYQAWQGKGYRSAYFGFAVASLVLGFIFLSVNGADLPPEQQSVREGVDWAGQNIGGLLVVTSFGCALGGLFYRRPVVVAATKPCRHCAEAILEAATVCRFCNREQ